MPKKRTVDSGKLLKAIESRQPSKAIMEKFGIKTSAQLKSLYLDALVSDGKAAGIAGRASKVKDAEAENQIVVNKRGSLVITRKMVEEMGFAIDDAFMARKTKAGVVLKKK